MSFRVGGKLRINDEEYQRLRELGWTLNKIAKAFGVSISTIIRYRKERGIA